MSGGRVDMGSAGVVNEKECLKNFEVHLTPPGVIDRLCRGEVQVICKEAIFLEELLELAERLGRRHMIVTDRCLKYGVY
jgi:hypothetical protein